MLKIIAIEGAGLLWPRILMARPLVWIFRNGYIHGCRRGLSRWVAHMMAEPQHLVQDHLSHVLHLVDHFKCEIKGLWARWLIRCIMPDVEIFVFQGIFHRDTRGWIKRQHSVQEVKSVRIGLRKQSLEGNLGHEGEIPDIFLSTWGSYPRQCFFVRGAQIVQDLVELVDVVTSLEEWPATQQLGQDTPN